VTGCGSTRDVKYDVTSERWLCRQCWERVNPRAFGKYNRIN
jgi:hypothetical protein